MRRMYSENQLRDVVAKVLNDENTILYNGNISFGYDEDDRPYIDIPCSLFVTGNLTVESGDVNVDSFSRIVDENGNSIIDLIAETTSLLDGKLQLYNAEEIRVHLPLALQDTLKLTVNGFDDIIDDVNGITLQEALDTVQEAIDAKKGYFHNISMAIYTDDSPAFGANISIMLPSISNAPLNNITLAQLREYISNGQSKRIMASGSIYVASESKVYPVNYLLASNNALYVSYKSDDTGDTDGVYIDDWSITEIRDYIF